MYLYLFDELRIIKGLCVSKKSITFFTRMLNYYAFIKQIDHFFVKNTFLMLVGWVPSFSDIGCTDRTKGTDRTWSSTATFGYDIKNRWRGEN